MNPRGLQPNSAPVQPAPAANAVLSAPVMDVVAPRQEAPAPTEVPVQSMPGSSADDVMAEELQGQTSGEGSPDQIIQEEINRSEATNSQAAVPVKAPKQPSNGVTSAIIATVIIVVVLAGFAVFAYMQTNK